MSNDTVVSLAAPARVSDPLTELLRTGSRRLVEAAVSAEFDEYLSAFVQEQLPDGRQRVVRNGHGNLPAGELDHQHAQPLAVAAKCAVDAVRPQVDPLVVEPPAAPLAVLLVSAALEPTDHVRRQPTGALFAHQRGDGLTHLAGRHPVHRSVLAKQ